MTRSGDFWWPVLPGLILVVCACSRPRTDQGTVPSDGTTGSGSSDGAIADTRGAARRIFITSEGVSGDLAGLDGADRRCTAGATAANLGGVWRAFLSTSAVNAIDRIANVSPWYDIHGTVLLFGTWDELTGNPRANIAADEHGNVADQVSIWTATRNGGYLSPSCADWTSGASNLNGVFGADGSSANAALWSLAGVGAQALHACDGMLHLLCIEQ